MDPVGIDKNIRAIKAIERSWNQPELPDMVSLDLAAMSGLNQKQLTQFLWGLESDITKVESQPMPTLDLTNDVDLMSRTEPIGESQEQGNLGPSNWNVFWSDIAGLQPATSISEDAVRNWKRQQMEAGRIPKLVDNNGNYVVDDKWGPEYQNLWNELSQEHWESSFRGNKYGAMSVQSVSELMAEWMSPTGLFKAAVHLDFIPDFDEIGRETTWNPLTWWRAIDDIAIPVLNWGLMATGVGEVILIGRAAYAGHKVAKGIDTAYDAYKTFNGITNGTRAGRIANKIGAPIKRVGGFGTNVGKYGDDLAAASQAALSGVRAPGWIGTKMANSSRTSLQALGKTSNWWRSKNSVALGKGITQQGMRLGLAGRIEGALGLDDSGAGGLDYIPGVDSASNWMYDNIVAAVMFESMFTPTRVLAVGSLSGLSPTNMLRGWRNVGQEASVSEDLFQGVDDLIDLQIQTARVDGADVGDLVKAQKQFHKNAKEHGKTKALMFYLYDDWTDIATEAPLEIQERFGAYVTYLGTMAAIDHAARGLAPALVKTSKARQNVQYHAARNQIINQIRYIDPDDWEQMMATRIWEQSNTTVEFQKTYDKFIKEFDQMSPAMQAAYIQNMKDAIIVHNTRRKEVFEVLTSDHLNAGVIKEYMGNHINTLGKTWKEFSDGMDIVNLSVAEGALDGARFTPALTDDAVSLMDEGMPVVEDVAMTDILRIFNDPEYLEFAKTSKVFNALNKAPNRTGRFTVARKDTISKQAKLEHVALVDQVVHLRTTLQNFIKGVVGENIPARAQVLPEVGKAIDNLIHQVGGDLAQMDIKAVDAALRNVNLKGRARSPFDAMETMAKRRDRLLRLIRYAQQQGMKVDGHEDLFLSVQKKLDDQIKYLDEDAHWVSKWKVDDVEDGLDPIMSLKAKSASLQRQAQFTASEVDVTSIPAKLAKELDDRGYKLVHGVEYATPADLNDLMIEMTDLKDAMRYRGSLGLEGSAFGDHIASSISRANYLRARAARRIAEPFNRFTRTQERTLYTGAMRNAFTRNFSHLNKGQGLTNSQYGQIDNVLQSLVSAVSKEYRQIMEGTKASYLASAANAPMKLINNLRVSFTPVVPTDLVRTKHLQRILIKALSEGNFKVKATLTATGKGRKGKDKMMRANLDFLVPDEAAEYQKALREFEEGTPELEQALEKYTEAKSRAANLIVDSLKESRVVGRQLRGFATNYLDKIQSTPQLTNVMRLLSKPEYEAATTGGKVLRNIGGTSVRLASFAAGAHLSQALNPTVEGHDSWRDWGISIVGGFAGMAFGTRVMVGSQNPFKATRFRNLKPIERIIGNDKNWTLFKASVQRAENSKAYRYDRSKMTGALNRWAAHIDQGNTRAAATMKAWSYLGDNLSYWRDFARFTLSPIFDASRYSEALVLGQIAAPEGINLRFNISPHRWRRDRANALADAAGISKRGKGMQKFRDQAVEEFAEVRARYKNAAARFADYDYDALEAATARFSQVGVLGFNTYEWETSVFADLVIKHGLDDIEAYKAAKHIFTYGVKPRSPAEVNINAIFFPFSFTKKTIGHAAKFAGQDWSRVAMIHNALRTYYELDDKYNLDDMYEAKLPIMDKLTRLNLLANGVALGQFGGANRPLLDTMLNVPILSEATVQPVMNSPIMNLFLPQVFDVSTPNSLNEAMSSFERTIPLINDMQDVWEDLSEQVYTFKSPTNITRRAEQYEGAIAVAGLKQSYDQAIRQYYGQRVGKIDSSGNPVFNEDGTRATEFESEYDFSNINNEDLSTFKKLYLEDLQALYDKYPAYYEGIAESVGFSVKKQQDMKEYVDAFKDSGLSVNELMESGTVEQKAGFLINMSNVTLSQYPAGTLSAAENVPDVADPAKGEFFSVQNMREVAITWVEDDPKLIPYYRRYLQPIWGPIENRSLASR